MLWFFCCFLFFFFFFNDTATTEIYTLSLHDALPISGGLILFPVLFAASAIMAWQLPWGFRAVLGIYVVLTTRSEEHTSELQSLAYLVCRLLLEKKKKKIYLSTAQLNNTYNKSSKDNG